MDDFRSASGALPSRPRRPGLLPWLLILLLLPACGSEPAGPADDGGGGGYGDGGQVDESYDHRLAAGASAQDFLAADAFQGLVVQVQYVEGHRPTDEALQRMEGFLTERLHKPAGIEVRLGDALPAPGRSTYTAGDVRAVEDEHRTVFTEGETLAAHVLFLNGEYEHDANVIGIAYNNTSVAIFSGPIEENTGGPIQPSRATVEATVTLHELGHLLGLVDNGSEMQTDHKDEEHGRHCDDDTCLMYYAVRTTDFLANLLGGDIPELDQNCLDDLAANGGR